MTYRDFARHVKHAARARGHDFTSPDDDWPITIITDHPGESPHAFDMPGWVSNSADAKRMLAAVLAESVRTTKPTKVAMVMSAWIITRPLDQPLPDKPPSQHSDRQEAVIAVIADAERSEAWMAEVKRTRLRPPALGSFRVSEPGVGGEMFEPVIEALR